MHIEIHEHKIVYVTAVKNEEYFLNDSISMPTWVIGEIQQMDPDPGAAGVTDLNIHAYLSHDPRRCRNYKIPLADWWDRLDLRSGMKWGTLKLGDYRCE